MASTVDLGNGVRVTAYPSLHSCVWSHTGMQPADAVCLGDLGVSLQEQQQRMAELTAFMTNELDPVAIDHLLVEQASDGIIELSDGCLCCSVRGELVEKLQGAFATLSFDDSEPALGQPFGHQSAERRFVVNEEQMRCRSHLGAPIY